MKDIAIFEAEEIVKLMDVLGVLENDQNVDKSEYFNAWNFGQQKGNCEFTINTTITESTYLNF